mgnify:CR=1 FL=1
MARTTGWELSRVGLDINNPRINIWMVLKAEACSSKQAYQTWVCALLSQYEYTELVWMQLVYGGVSCIAGLSVFQGGPVMSLQAWGGSGDHHKQMIQGMKRSGLWQVCA